MRIATLAKGCYNPVQLSATMCTPLSQENIASSARVEFSRYHTKNRIVAVDISRILAALGVMYGHLFFPPVTSILPFLPEQIFGALSSVFFVLAGYFSCRNISWKKALNNAWWCLVPFLIWNTACILIAWYQGDASLQESTIAHWYGLSAFLWGGIQYPGMVASMPCDSPLWFMRDLIFLFLLSPILYRYAKYLFPITIVISLYPPAQSLFTHANTITLSSYSIGFFLAGCYLRSLPKDFQKKALSFYSPWIIIGFVLIKLIYILVCNLKDTPLASPFVGSLVSIWILYQTARWIEEKVPYAKELALKLAPVTFLTFAAHWIFYFYLIPNSWLQSALFVYTLPLSTFAVLTLFFFALKRWARPLLHPIAHYKLRPDDLSPSSDSSTRSVEPVS